MTITGLLEQICVAQEPVVGVYGFIFFRDGAWVDVIIDDQLFVSFPEYESLSQEARAQGTVDEYNIRVRKGNKVLYFAKSMTEGETWVPLIEKAYAKLHGNYHYIVGGFANEAIEDLTGAVCSRTSINYILDPNKFWNELVATAGRTRLYGCFLRGDDQSASDVHDSEYGLIASHAYTVLKAVEYKGKRFVLVQNPWGSGEWKGRWSDGSNEWTAEWKPVLKMLKHEVNGEDGAFVMEFGDFLTNWTKVDCARLFDYMGLVGHLAANGRSRTFAPLDMGKYILYHLGPGSHSCSHCSSSARYTLFPRHILFTPLYDGICLVPQGIQRGTCCITSRTRH